jgi:hypothetical protein
MSDSTEHLIMDSVRIYGVMDRGNLWLMSRSTDKETFDAFAVDAGLKFYTNPSQAEVLDEDGEVERQAVAASGPLKIYPDVTIAEPISHVLKAGVYDAEGNETTAPVMDNRYHVNIWIGPKMLSRNAWMRWATLWTHYGDAIVANAGEDGTAMSGVELIDPATVAQPANLLL